MTQFQQSLLELWVNIFYGYGNYDGRFWFIGMEEAGGNSIEEINRRLQVWDQRGQKELEDVAQYHIELGMREYFTSPAKLQPTWNRLIRIYLTSQGETPTTEQVREYQANHLGRHSGDTCLVELLPLPSPSTGHWLYAEAKDIPYLATRDRYLEKLTHIRIDHLQRRIMEHRPPTVVFYSFSYRQYWEALAGTSFGWDPDLEIYAARAGHTRYLVTKHPAGRGLDHGYFHRVGEFIKKELHDA